VSILAIRAEFALFVFFVQNSEMTYNVSMGVLNPTIPYHTVTIWLEFGIHEWKLDFPAIFEVLRTFWQNLGNILKMCYFGPFSFLDRIWSV